MTHKLCNTLFIHFKTALQELEQKICYDFDIAEYELEEAVTEYCDDEEISKHVKVIKKLITRYGGTVESDEIEVTGVGGGTWERHWGCWGWSRWGK